MCRPKHNNVLSAICKSRQVAPTVVSAGGEGGRPLAILFCFLCEKRDVSKGVFDRRDFVYKNVFANTPFYMYDV